ncbi:MAG: PstS family phosphate ABC transporter substrate-binding protein [Desulfobacterales bacterium]|nr:PstS family phosphate ABC transporter substrate-binding protein [Desulfobacterales bacterium]
MKTMAKIKMTLLALAVAAAFAAVWAAPAGAQSSALSGKVVVDGSSTVYPVTEAAAAAFRDDFPNVNVTVAISGTGGGFKRFVRGDTDISDASRPIKAKEFKAAAQNGVRFIELPVAMDGLSVVVNPKNDWADELSIQDLQAIYLEDGTARKWSDLDPAWPDEPIKVYSPGTDSGTFDYFREVVLPEGKSFRPDMSTSEDDNVLVTGVSGDRYAIGYFGAAYYYENKTKLTAVPVVNPKTGKAVLPEPENVINGDYFPLSRPLFIYVNFNSLRRPEVREFVNFYLAHDDRFATEVGYVAVPDEIGSRAESFLKQRLTGTTYMTPEMEKREGGLNAIYKKENLLDTK